VLVRAAFGLGLVVATSAVLNAFGADLTVAAVVLMLAVLAASVLGLVTGLLAAVAATGLLLYFFSEPKHSFHVGHSDDIVALVAFVAVSAVVSATVARLELLRRRSEDNAAAARRADADAREQRVRAEIDRSRAGFLSAVTHDLRTPLATIKAAAASLRPTAPALRDQDRAELVDVIVEESARLERLVDKALALTRLRAGALVPEVVDTTVAEVVHIAVARLAPADAARLDIDLDPELPFVRVDEVLVQHALANLIENAVAYAPVGPIRIEAHADAEHVEIRVVDHGPGIPEGERERVFEEFVRLPTPSPRPGSGLGLSVARGLAEASGGSVRCTATPGGGATIVLTIPSSVLPAENAVPGAEEPR
jgi:two-component system sensor histidine kinase KdpD